MTILTDGSPDVKNCFERLIFYDDLFFCFQCGFHNLVFIGARGKQQYTAMLEHKRNRTIRTQITAKLAKGMAYISHRAQTVIGQAIHHHSSTANAITFIADFFIIHTIQLPGTTLDRVLDIILGH